MNATNHLFSGVSSRRQWLKLMATSGALAALPFARRTQAATASFRVVVVGAGFAGATLAKYLRLWGNGAVEVTLVEPNPSHIACIGSNLVVTGALELGPLTLSLAPLNERWGVRVVQDTAVSFDATARRLSLGSGQSLSYDRLVLAPGVAYQPLSGLDSSRIPHAWQAGPQTLLLKNQLLAMSNGGAFVMTIPPAPYRCPPGPYERACLVADWMKKHRPRSRVVVLDANADIVAEKHSFKAAFDGLHAGYIDYRPGVTVQTVDSSRRRVQTSQGVLSAEVLNVIPAQRAPELLQPLVRNGELWAAVQPLTYESSLLSGVHVIGDAQDTSQPKSGHMANAQAKVCADAILRAFAGLPPDANPKTSSACYSPVTHELASWLSVVYGYDPVTQSMQKVPESQMEARSPSRDAFQEMYAWGANLFADSFG